MQDKGSSFDGKALSSTYSLNPDGREHKQPNGDVITTTRNGLVLTSTVQTADDHKRTEVRTLSHDRRQLTLDVTGTDSNGKSFHDLLVFEKPKG